MTTRAKPSLLIISSLLLCACGKGESKNTADPELQKKLDGCEATLETKNKELTRLSDQMANAEGQVTEHEIEFKKELYKIVAKAPKSSSGVSGGGLTDKQMQKFMPIFLKQANAANGRIKRCYQNALKKDSSLSDSTINLKVRVKFRQGGKYQTASFSPKLSDNFSRCMFGIVSTWKVPELPQKQSFAARFTLTPQ